MSFSIEGKVAIVTGAANGIGLAVARHFLEAGANVMFADLDEARLVDELGDLGEEGQARYFAGDLTERLTLANLLSATIDAFDRVDILVNAARRVSRTDPLDPEDQSLDLLIQRNLMTSYRMSQVVARRMIRQAGDEQEGMAGAIINLSSIAAQRVHPELLGFSVAMAAVEQMTRSLAVTLAPHRIRVNAVAFGSVMSAALRDALKDDPAARDEMARRTPLGRIAPAAELAETVQYLASDAAGFVTGQVLTVDGGRTLIDPVASASH